MPNSSNLSFILFLFLFVHELAAQSFTIPIRISDGSNQLILKFGIHPQGSDNYDSGLDIYAPPPPPAGAFDARFTFKQEDYFIDIRGNSLNEKEYHLKYQPEGQKKITLYWNSDTLVQFGSFNMVDSFTSQVFTLDMTEAESLDISTVQILNSGLKILVTPLPTSLCFNMTKQAQNKIKLKNLPNPFNAKTIIEYSLKEPTDILLEIYNQTGQKVKELTRGFHSAGDYQYFLESSELGSGYYYCVLKTEKEMETIKLLNVR